MSLGDGALGIITHSAVSVGTTTTAVLAANGARLWALIENDSDETIYIKIGAEAVMNEGIGINASGSSFEMGGKLGNLNSGAINGICATGGKLVLVTEGV